MEHSGFSFETVKSAVRYCEAAQLPAIVRVPSKSYHHIARAADIGAEAVMVPMVDTDAEARELVVAPQIHAARRPRRRARHRPRQFPRRRPGA